MSRICYTFRDEGKCNFGDTCRFSHDLNSQSSGASFSRRGTNVCYAFQRDGNCQFGDACRFSHDNTQTGEAADRPAPRRFGGSRGGYGRGRFGDSFRANRPPRAERDPNAPINSDRLECHNFKQSGSCSYGQSCRFLHGDEPTRGNRKKQSEVCYAFRDKGECQYGDACRYSHSAPQAEITAQ